MKELTAELEAEVLEISARQIDRRIKEKKHVLKRRLYGRTKPGTLLKGQIAIKTSCWEVSEPGFTEVDTVAHGGPCAPPRRREFGHSLNVTDLLTQWAESCAVGGRGEHRVVCALDEIRRQLPCARRIDSDPPRRVFGIHQLQLPSRWLL